jgi:HPt (histidine-containing phosphotransfer) domain-containing protein
MKFPMGTNNISQQGDSNGPLLSQYANDKDMAELVDFFVGELQERMGALNEAWKSGDRIRLKSLAHQLKGAAGGYGFPSITHSAAALEATLKTQESEVASVGKKLDELLELCRRAVPGDGTSPI